MRKLMISLLLASAVATPALAQDQDGGRRDRGSRSAQSDDDSRAERRAARAERIETRRAERSQRAERPQAQPHVPATVAEAPRRPRLERSRENDAAPADTRRNWRNSDSMAGRIIEHAQRDGSTELRHDRDRDQSHRHRDGDRRWSSHWRSDNRYDWRRHRDRNRSIFRFGNYYDPYRYGYRRFSIGFNLWPSYYSSRYWLNDPWQYRLPPAYGPYRWVRYYDDALLVNIYTGQVVDVIHSFFW